MAGTTLGFLKFVLGFDTIAFKKGMTQADRDLVALQKKVQKFGKGMADIGKSMSIAITAPLIAFAASGVKEAQETAVAMGKVNNALAQTGAVAKQTAPALQKAADALELKSVYEADEILSQVTSRLLSFGKIAPQNFQIAQQAAVDFASKTGKGLEESAVVIGKALSSPTKGLKALQAVGVTFTKDQTKQLQTMVDTGHAAEAQAIIFEKLKATITGTAEQAQNTDPWNKLTDAYKQLAEQVGTVLLPHLITLANKLVEVIKWFGDLDPSTQKWVLALVAVAAAAGPVIFAIGQIIQLAAGVKTLILFAQGLTGLATAETLAAGGAAAMGAALAPAVIALGLFGAAVAAVYVAFKYWPQISKFVVDLYATIKSYLVDKLNAVWAWLKGKVEAVVGWFKWMADQVALHSLVPDMVDKIETTMKRLPKAMVEPTKRATEEVTALFEDMAKIDWMPEIGFVSAGSTDVTDETVKGLAEVAQVNKDTTAEMAKEWGDMASKAIGAMRGMVDAFKGGDILGGIQLLLDTVLDVLKSLAKIGVFGTSIPGFGGGLAAGGPMVPGKTYLVGENGPEFVTPKRKGYVHPNGSNAEPQRVIVVPSPYFDVVVDHRAANVAAPMAGKAAVIGVTGSEARMVRRSRRNLLAA